MQLNAVAVLIVSYNVRAALARALATMPRACEVVVVDNASGDGTVAMARAQFPRVDVIASPTNLGFARAVNLAASRARASHYLWLNPDAWLPRGSIEKLVARYVAHSAAHPRLVLGPRQVDAAGRLQLAFGPAPTLWGEFGRRLVQRRLDRPNERRAAWVRAAIDCWVATPRPVAWVAGSALLVGRRTFWHVGGLDPGYFLFFEDMDFCLRVRRAGGTVIYDPTVTVGHSRGVSAAGAAQLAARAYRDSQARFARQHQGELTGWAMARWAAHRRPDGRPVP